MNAPGWSRMAPAALNFIFVKISTGDFYLALISYLSLILSSQKMVYYNHHEYLNIPGKVKRSPNEQLFIQGIDPLLFKILIHSKEAKIRWSPLRPSARLHSGFSSPSPRV